jgi:hypothetical protein
MKTLLKCILPLLLLVNFINNVQASTDLIFVDRMMISNSIKNKSNKIKPNSSNWYLSNEDQDIFYYAQIGIINPTATQYEIKLVCIDEEGIPIFRKNFKVALTKFSGYQQEKNTIKLYELTLNLNPKPNALVKGQIAPLKDDNNYLVKLFINKKLIGITQFHYEIW